MSDEDKIKFTQKEAAQGLTRRVVAIAAECAKAGMPPAAISVAIMSAGIGLSCQDEGVPATVQLLRGLAAHLERGDSIHPEGTA